MIVFMEHKILSKKYFKRTIIFLEILATYNKEVLILGDFIFHLEQSDNTDAQTYLKILRSHGLYSSTKDPTHYQRGWLDVIVSRKSDNINYIDSGIFGHKLLLCNCEMLKPHPIYRQLQFRRWKFLDTERFISELKLSCFQLPQVLMWTQLLTFIIPFCQGSLTRWLLLRPLEYMKDLLIHGLIGSVVLQNVWKRV